MLKRALRREGVISGVYAIVRVLNEMNATDATVLDVTRSNEPARRWTYAGIKDYNQFVLDPDFLDADADVEGSDDVLTTAWRVRPLSGLGAAVPLDTGTWRRVEPRLTHAEATGYLLTAVQRFGNSRLLRDSVVHFVDENGFASSSAAFGDERSPSYVAIMRALETVTAKYSDAVRTAAGAGGQRKPHTLARAMATCEYEMQRAEKAAAAARAARVDTAGDSTAVTTPTSAVADCAPANADRAAAAGAQLDPAAAGSAPQGGGGEAPVARASWRQANVDPRASAVALGYPRAPRRARTAQPQDGHAADE